MVNGCGLESINWGKTTFCAWAGVKGNLRIGLQAKVWVPLDLMQRMQERVVDRSGPQHAGLLVTLLSDFQEVLPTLPSVLPWH